MKIYLASNYGSRGLMLQHAAEIAALGHTVTSRWIHGNSKSPCGCAADDLEDLESSDLLVFFTEDSGPLSIGGKSFELGYAYHARILTAMIGKRRSVFHYLPSLIWFDDFASFLKSLKGCDYVTPIPREPVEESEDLAEPTLPEADAYCGVV